MNYEEILFINQVPTALLDFLKKNPDNWLLLFAVTVLKAL